MHRAAAVPPFVGAVVAGTVVVLHRARRRPDSCRDTRRAGGDGRLLPPHRDGVVVPTGTGRRAVAARLRRRVPGLPPGGRARRRAATATAASTSRRSGPAAETQGDPAPMLLSPDGTRVAVGDHDVERPDVVVVDLTTGDTTRYALPAGRSVVPVAWSSDGETLASLVSDEADQPLLRRTDRRLDRPARPSRRLCRGPGARRLRRGCRLLPGRLGARRRAVRRSHGGGPGGRRPAQPRGRRRARRPAAWSPDGRLLAVTTVEPPGAPPGVDAPGVPSGLSFVDADGRGDAVPDPLPLDLAGPGRVLGWAGDAEVVTVLAGRCRRPDPVRRTARRRRAAPAHADVRPRVLRRRSLPARVVGRRLARGRRSRRGGPRAVAVGPPWRAHDRGGSPGVVHRPTRPSRSGADAVVVPTGLRTRPAVRPVAGPTGRSDAPRRGRGRTVRPG